jgi:hypothetical protein
VPVQLQVRADAFTDLTLLKKRAAVFKGCVPLLYPL